MSFRDKRKAYRLDMTLADYVARRENELENQRQQDELKATHPWPTVLAITEPMPSSAKTPRSPTQELLGSPTSNKESIMTTRECKIETKDKVEFIEGKAPKFDSGKVRLDLLPVRPLKDIAEVLSIGADKYGANSWREGEMIAWSRCYSATQRHLMQFWSGEDLDEETKLSHLAHAACNILFMIEHSYINKQGDDRPQSGTPFKDKE
jgi:hypothetical protein